MRYGNQVYIAGFKSIAPACLRFRESHYFVDAEDAEPGAVVAFMCFTAQDLYHKREQRLSA